MGVPFLTSTPDGGEWSAARPSRFTTGDIAPRTHWIGSCVGPRAGLDAVEERQNLPCKKSNPGLPARNPSLYLLNYSDSELIVVYLKKKYFNVCLEVLKKISSNSDIKEEAFRSRLEPGIFRIRNS
jgi:hypothetical protein